MIAIATVLMLRLPWPTSATVNLDHAVSVFTALLRLAVLILQLLHRRLMRLLLINSIVVVPTIRGLVDLTLIGDHIRLVLAFVILLLVNYNLAVCDTCCYIVEAYGL